MRCVLALSILEGFTIGTFEFEFPTGTGGVKLGATAGLVGDEDGVVSEVSNLESSACKDDRWRGSISGSRRVPTVIADTYLRGANARRRVVNYESLNCH
jgi:hypothetical protein